MALPNTGGQIGYDQISAITQKKYIPKLYDNIFNSNPLLQRHRKKSYEKVDGGTSILIPLNYAVPTATGWYFGADTLSVTDNDQVTVAKMFGDIKPTLIDLELRKRTTRGKLLAA